MKTRRRKKKPPPFFILHHRDKTNQSWYYSEYYRNWSRDIEDATGYRHPDDAKWVRRKLEKARKPIDVLEFNL